MRTGPTTPFSLFVLLILVHFACSAAAADVVEFTSGAKLEGEITARDDKMVTVEVLLGGRTFTRT